MRIFYLSIIGLLFFVNGFSQTQTVTFDNSGSFQWTAPCGVTSITVEAWGAGAAGTSNGGGGGGAYAKKEINVSSEVTYTLVVGRGGGTYSSGGWFGTTIYSGENSSFHSNEVRAEGGGQYGSNYIMAGRASNTTGDTRYSGGSGVNGTERGGGGGGSSASSISNGNSGQNSGNNSGAMGGVAPLPDGGKGGDGGNGTSNFFSSSSPGKSGSIPGGGGGQGGTGFWNSSGGGNGAGGQIIITYNGMPDNYCTPSFSTVESITNVTFAGINNTTPATSTRTSPLLAYESFCEVGNVSLGSTYPITVKGNTAGNYTNYFTVFIDWNGNGKFDDAGEIYKIGTIINSSGIDGKTTPTFNITVPATAQLGTTKMRVLKSYGSNYVIEPCITATYGQVEDYVIEVSGGCQQPTSASLSDGANTSSTTLVICAGTSVNLKQIGGQLGPNQNWEWYTGSCGGTRISSNNNSDASFSVTPAVTTTYFVRAVGGTCGSTGICKSVTVVVNTNGTISYTSGNQNLTICKNTLITPVVYTVGGGANTASIVWTTGIPSGISASYNSTNKIYTISGTSNVTGKFDYTITAGGNSPCSNDFISGSITVTEAPGVLKYTNETVTYCSGGPITPNIATVNNGGSEVTFEVSPALPAGLNFNTTNGTISGAPTHTQGITNYTVKGSNSCGTTLKVIRITISSGDQAFSVTPGGIQNICSLGGSVPIGLSNSVTGIKYQLYKDGVPTGTALDGTGSPVSFGNLSAAGVYTVKTYSSCATNMIGSTTIIVTQQPTTNFTYSIYNFCTSGNSPAAILAGSPLNGSFSASPGGLVFADNNTGEIDLAASIMGSYTLTYTIAAAGGCGVYSYTHPTKINIVTTADIYSVTGGGGYCTGSGGVPVGLENSQSGVSYQLYRDGTILVNTLAGTGAALNFGNQTVAGNYFVKATLGSCFEYMDREAVVTINPTPANIQVTPTSATLCQGSIIPLTASLSPANVTTKSVSASFNTNQTITRNNASGTFSVLKVSEIPVGATITGVSVNFRISQSRDQDLVINLKGPNGNVLNIANKIGGNNANFGNNTNNTFVNSTSTNNITTGSAPYTSGPYSPQAAGGVAGATSVSGNQSNTTTFDGLYGATAASANGNWIFSVRNTANNNNGTLNNCEIVITYAIVNNPTSVTWSPATGLYTDPGATIPYTIGNSATTVYAKPSVSGNIPYTATAGTPFGCNTTATTTLKVNPSPVITISANYCNFPGVIRITAKSNIAIDTWIWSTGSTTGTKNRTGGDTSFIDVNLAGDYYVSAKPLGNSCPGNAVMSIAQELVKNGDFEQGFSEFSSGYYYQSDVAGNNELVNDKIPVNNGFGVGTNGQNYHPNFWGVDHTYGTGSGNFMIVNGHGSLDVWKNENVTVLPNTTYYFSGWGISLNAAGYYAKLKFIIDGAGTYKDNFQANLASGTEENFNNGWQKFYGTWTSGPTTTSVNLSIVNLETALGGNDFGLDDISFATLSSFFKISSDPGTNNQTGRCVGTPITDIIYEVGGDGNPPTLFSGAMPPGLTTYWNGRDFRISGTPTIAGNYNFTLKLSGCNEMTQNITINVLPASKAGTSTGGLFISSCYGASGAITLDGTVGNIQWQTTLDTTSAWNNVANANYSNLQSALYYRGIAQNTIGCEKDTSFAVKLGVRNLWIGKTNDQWNTNTNWSDGSLPNTALCDNVIIPVVPSNKYPILNSGVASVNNLSIHSNAKLVLQNGLLQVAGIITNIGTLDATKGTIEFNGATTQTLSGSILKDKTIKNLTVSNIAGLKIKADLNDTLNITGTLAFGKSTAKLSTGDNITLKSTAQGTANVGVVGNDNTITGKFVVERFINTGTTQNPGAHAKSWQFLATPTTGATIKESWQEGAVANGKLPVQNATKGFGTLLTTGYNNVPVNGFDVFTAPGPSIKTYNSETNSYDKGPISTSELLYNPKGYLILVRGDRTVYTSSGAATPTVLRSKGNIITGTTAPITVKADSWESIGNPYPSQLDLRELKRTGGVGEFIFVWDPKLGGAYGLGGYQTLILSGGNYYATPGRGSYGSGVNNFIQSGQAFFVQAAKEEGGTVFFTESMKESGSVSLLRGGAGGRSTVGQIRTSLNGIANGEPFLTDGNLVQFSEDFSNDIDGMDARKITNNSENFGIRSGVVDLVVERRKNITAADTILFRMSGVRVQAYQLEIEALNLNIPGLEAWLEDSYLQTRTPLHLQGTTTIDFTIVNIPGSYASERFKIVFKPAAAAPLPVTFLSINASRKNAAVLVDWKVEAEMNLQQYEVEKSTDGVYFSKVAVVLGNDNNHGKYEWLDQESSVGYNYYRIRSVDLDGKTSISSIAKILRDQPAGSISVYPNPITNGVVNIQLGNQPEGVYGLRLINPVGQVLVSKKIEHAGGNHTEKINWDYKMARGMYQLEVTKPGGGVHLIKVVY